MRIERLRIPAFGPLRDIDTGPDPLPGFVVVTGPNEAGKTTLLEAIRTLLHGIYPARRDAHPLAPWDGTEGEILGDFRTRDGSRFHAHRRILAAPWGRLYRNDVEEDLRNAHLPPADHVPREIYRQVHAIDLPELTRLQQGNAWNAIRDRILAGMGTRDMAPPRTVADALEGGANALWRPDRRSRTRDMALGTEIEERTADLREARSKDQELREARDAVDWGDARLAALRRERAELAERVRRAAELLPLGARIRHLDTLRREAGDPSELATLPASPRERRRELLEIEEGLEAEVRRFEAAVSEAGSRVPPPSASEDRILELRGELEALRVEATGAEDARQRARELAGEAVRVQAEVEDLATPLLDDAGRWLAPPRRSELLAALRAVALDELRTRLVERSAAEARRAEAEERLSLHRARPEVAPPPLRPASTVRLLLGMSALVFLAAIAVLLRGTADSWIVLGALVGAVALGAAAIRIRAGNREAAAGHERALAERRAEAQALEDRLRSHDRAVSEASAGVGRCVAELPLHPERVTEGREGLATSLERLRERLRELERLHSAVGAEEERVVGINRSILALVDRLQRAEDFRDPDQDSDVDPDVGPDVDPDPDPERDPAPATASPTPAPAPAVALAPLLTRLEEAGRAAETRRQAIREVEDARRRLEEAGTRLAEARGRRETLDDALRRITREAAGSGTPEAGPGVELTAHPTPAHPTPGPGSGADGRTEPSSAVEVAERRLEALRQARHLERELQAAHGSLPELRIRVREAESEWHADGTAASTADLARAHARIEALAEEIEAAATELQRNRSLLEQVDQVLTADLLESELARLREERTIVRRERDRLWVLARVTRVAEQRFREAHQPRLVRRAEEVLSVLTRGRYDSLLLGDERDPGALQVRGSHLPGALPVESPLSAGTREQIWFALRMAVVDLVEGGGEPLPLVLDEVFVNWDPDRRGAALDALADLAERRQIFLVTCHPHFAREAASRGAGVVELAPLGRGILVPDPSETPGRDPESRSRIHPGTRPDLQEPPA
ncbi:MAG: hypothetical protein EA350_09175 [Gemmatimonadales bacterium]|nr:MAG: hypothetical protein EA350_09175 [Gemmatimonadales bacterium]